MLSENRWDGHVVDIEIDDTNEQFVGIIRNIRERRVSFAGRDYQELKSAYVSALQKYREDPGSFPETNREEQAIGRFTNRSRFRDVYSSEQISSLHNYSFKAGSDEDSTHANPRHPLDVIIKAYEGPHGSSENTVAIANNTENCLELISQNQPAFLSSIEERLFDRSDYTNSSSALAELRAFGALCSTSLRPEEISTSNDKTADFRLTVGEAQCLIEVHTRFSSEDDERQLQVEDVLGEQEGDIRIERISNVTPFGQPDESKPNDGVSTNMISKICAMKQEESQFEDDKINILWIDLQDSEVLRFSIDVEQCLPHYTYSYLRQYTMPYTGCVWQAFYGCKGDPVIESYMGTGFAVHKMGHDGRFVQDSIVNFAVVSLPDALAVYENPRRTHMVDQDVRKMFYRMPLFSVQHSLLETYPNILESTIRMQKAQRDYCIKTYWDFSEPINDLV